MVNILQIVALPRPIWGVYKLTGKEVDLTQTKNYWISELFLVAVVERHDPHPLPDGEIFKTAELLHDDDCGSFTPVSDSGCFVEQFKTKEEAQEHITLLAEQAKKQKEHSNGKMVAQQ